jgi:hypothetical protein
VGTKVIQGAAGKSEKAEQGKSEVNIPEVIRAHAEGSKADPQLVAAYQDTAAHRDELAVKLAELSGNSKLDIPQLITAIKSLMPSTNPIEIVDKVLAVQKHGGGTSSQSETMSLIVALKTMRAHHLWVDNTWSDREINDFRKPTKGRGTLASRYNCEFMVQFFLAMLSALHAFLRSRSDAALEILALPCRRTAPPLLFSDPIQTRVPLRTRSAVRSVALLRSAQSSESRSLEFCTMLRFARTSCRFGRPAPR